MNVGIPDSTGVSIAVANTMTKSHLGRKDLLPYYRWQSIMKRGVRTQTRGRDLSRGQGDMLLLVLSAGSPHGPRPHPSLIKKLPHGMSTTQSDGGIFSTVISSSLVTIVYQCT